MSAPHDGPGTALFLVELRAGAAGSGDVSGMCRALRHAVTRLRDAGTVVRWCGALHLPDQARCLCLVEAEHRASAVLARDTAGLPAGSVSPAFCVGAPCCTPLPAPERGPAMSLPQMPSTTAVTAPRRGGPTGSFRGWTVRRPLTAFLVLVLGFGWPVMSLAALTDHGVVPGGGLPGEVWVLAVLVLVMMPAALWVTSVTDGRSGVRALLNRAFRWRIGAGWWAVVLLAIPLTTLAVGVATGRSLQTSDLAGALGGELVALVAAVVLANLWEETVWAGFLQTRLERRYGLLRAAALTAVPFAAIHLPLQFVGDFSAASVATGAGLLLGIGVLFRLMVGVVLRAAADSVLAVAVLHAVWNTSNNEDGLADQLLSGGPPTVLAITAVALLTAVVAVAVRPRLTRDFRERAG